MMTVPERSPVTVDERGFLRAAGVHDSTLKAFSYETGRLARFVLHSPDGGTLEVSLQEPALMSINQMWEGTIVDTIFVWRVDRVPHEIWNEEDNGWNALLAERISKNDRFKEADRIKLKYPDHFLVIVSCSYGGNWASVVKNITILGH